jgi:DNA-binding NarL/FixJ family response regulator
LVAVGSNDALEHLGPTSGNPLNVTLIGPRTITPVDGEALDDPGALIAAGGLAYVDDRFDEARVLWEEAFKRLRAAGATAAAARVATLLGELHWGGLGHASVGRGWFERADRLLAEIGPCVERGYWELGRLACDRADVDELLGSAERALAIAIDFGDLALQTRALADAGYALVAKARLREGFARLEEALAVISSGEVTDPFAVSTACCSALSACDRAGDPELAGEWLRVVDEAVLGPAQGRPRMLGAHCRLALGGVLCTVGRWTEAEEAMRASLLATSGATASQRIQATARLSELLVLTNQLDDAAELIATVEDHHDAAHPRALLWLRLGQARLAAAAIHRGIDALPGDALRQSSLLALLVEAELACDDAGAAADAATRLRQLAIVADAPVVDAVSAVADARIELHSGSLDEAVVLLDKARSTLEACPRPLQQAEVDALLAEAIRDTSPDIAVAAARRAHAAAQRLGATQLRDRAAALLRALGATPPRITPATSVLAELTPRESEILAGIRRGETNAEIATRLFVSPKTVERHVSNLFVKLGVRSRAEAASVAAAAQAAHTPV